MAISQQVAAETAPVFQRERVLEDLSKVYGGQVKAAVGQEFSQIPGNDYQGKRLYYSGSNPDQETGLRAIAFQDYSQADDFLAFFNKKHGCALLFEFERDNRATTERAIVVMQYNGKIGELAFKDVVIVKSEGDIRNPDKTIKVPDDQLQDKVNGLMTLLATKMKSTVSFSAPPASSGRE